MSSQRVLKQLEAMPDKIRRLGHYSRSFTDALVWAGPVTTGAHAGADAAVIDFTSNAWADNNLRVIVLSVPASDRNNTASMKTQSHAAGLFIDGSVSYRLYFEAPEGGSTKAALQSAQFQFDLQVLQHLRGQLGAPIEVFWGDNDVEPKVEGVNGASAADETTSAFVSGGEFLPDGAVAYPGGV